MFAWGFGIEKREGSFGDVFAVSVSWETKHEKSSREIRGKFGGESG